MLHSTRLLRLSSSTGLTAASLAVCLVLVGCPFFQPVLTVSPSALSFGTITTRQSFAVYNAGRGTLNWSVSEVVWDGTTQTWLDQDVSWLSIDADTTSGAASGETDRVFLNADRDGLPPATYSGAGIKVTSDGGTAVVPVSMTVPTSSTGGGTDAGKIEVAPTDVTLNGLEDTAAFAVSNVGKAQVRWYASIQIDADFVPTDAPIQVATNPSTATTLPNDETTVTVSIPDPVNFDTTFLNYTISIRNQTDDAELATVKVTVDQVGPPVVAVDPALLDFGESGYQVSFQVANLGNAYSLLNFAVFSRKQVDDTTYSYAPYDVDSDALIATIDAPSGMDNVKSDVNTATDVPWQYARTVTVTISRDGIENDLEYRDLWIGAVAGTDESGKPIIDTGVTPQKVQVRVAAAPYMEGAENRSRPPSLERFVFTLRDKRGIAIDASNQLIRSQMKFSVREDDFPLDPYESSQFITGPENLKQNLILLLDFTGSMYNAGVEDTNMLAQGEAITQMVESAKQFILDLPTGYKVAIMEYHDRQQPSNMIHGFDTNKATLIASLDSFSLPPAEHGASEILDVLYDACQALVQEDPAQLLPFDEADVRSVVFISDGWDTSSTKKLEEVIKFAQDSRVRFYPIGFSGRASNPVNDSVLIQLATETGGHTYHAGELNDLTQMLDSEKSLSFNATAIDLAHGKATLRIRNAGAEAISWSAIENISWLTVFPPAGSIPPLHRRTNGTIDETGVRDITISTASGFPAGTYEGSITIQSDSGNAVVNVSMTVDAGGALTRLAVLPQTDDPGRLWRELRGQVVLTYTSLFQAGFHTYLISASFPDSKGKTATANFEKDGVYYAGDPRAGQISLATTGVQNGTAEIFVRTDYVPRNITQFRFRFILDVPDSLTPNLSPAERSALLTKLKTALSNGAVKLASGGLLSGWRLITSEGNGIFTAITEPSNYLTYASAGNLFKITFDGLGANDAFTLGMRADNSLYYSPATTNQPSLTKYFLYPGGYLNPKGILTAAQGSNIIEPSLTLEGFTQAFDPEAANAWDRDGDSWPDFDDSDPDNPDVGDIDRDGTPDLDDPAPRDPNIP